uniref:Uncharacterized protein n=1 Tax=Cyprinus carpio TaxID=7962 RepID=A0A8C2KWX6_CYPCA
MDDGSPRALKAVLIDLSGTLHIEDPAVPGAQEASIALFLLTYLLMSFMFIWCCN